MLHDNLFLRIISPLTLLHHPQSTSSTLWLILLIYTKRWTLYICLLERPPRKKNQYNNNPHLLSKACIKSSWSVWRCSVLGCLDTSASLSFFFETILRFLELLLPLAQPLPAAVPLEPFNSFPSSLMAVLVIYRLWAVNQADEEDGLAGWGGSNGSFFQCSTLDGFLREEAFRGLFHMKFTVKHLAPKTTILISVSSNRKPHNKTDSRCAASFLQKTTVRK